MKHFFGFLLLGYSLVLISGCGQKAPPGFPAVYPMTVTITDGTTPLPDVRVTLHPANMSSGDAHVSSGVTSARGIATLGTGQGSYSKKGIPEGEHIVILEEMIEVDVGMTPEEFLGLTPGEKSKKIAEMAEKRAAVPRKVPEVLCKVGADKDAHPLRYTATKGKNELSIDVAQYKK